MHDLLKQTLLSPLLDATSRKHGYVAPPQVLSEPLMAAAQQEGDFVDHVTFAVGTNPPHTEPQTLCVAGKMPSLDLTYGWGQAGQCASGL